MNVSAAYNSLPDFNNRIQVDTSASSYENKPKSLLPVPLELSSGQKRKYNYYVLEDHQEIIYNTKKHTEKINNHLLGAMINIFV